MLITFLREHPDPLRNTKHPKYNKSYIYVLGPSNNHYRRQSEPPTRRCRRSTTRAGQTLSGADPRRAEWGLDLHLKF
jgi:hypothetical protein